MSLQIDLFANGDADSVPPWQDPDKVSQVTIDHECDADHVGEAAIGRVGNNREVDVVRVWGRDGTVLHSETFPRRSTKWGGSRYSLAATDCAARIQGQLGINRQAKLFA